MVIRQSILISRRFRRDCVGRFGARCYPMRLRKNLIRVLLPAALPAALLAAGCSHPSSSPAGAASDVYPAFREAIKAGMPQVVRQSPAAGSVLTAPVLVPVTYANDANRADMETFVHALADSDYFGTVTGQYGVGKPTVGTVVELTSSA